MFNVFACQHPHSDNTQGSGKAIQPRNVTVGIFDKYPCNADKGDNKYNCQWKVTFPWSVHDREVFGATGKREDHTLGNISLLLDYMKSGMEVRTITDYGVFVPAKDTQTFAAHPGQQISIINFGAKGLQGEGLVYPLSDFTNWWQGTLNEATSDEFTIHCTGEYLVFLAFM